jgi:hypothetical protein
VGASLSYTSRTRVVSPLFILPTGAGPRRPGMDAWMAVSAGRPSAAARLRAGSARPFARDDSTLVPASRFSWRSCVRSTRLRFDDQSARTAAGLWRHRGCRVSIEYPFRTSGARSVLGTYACVAGTCGRGRGHEAANDADRNHHPMRPGFVRSVTYAYEYRYREVRLCYLLAGVMVHIYKSLQS